MSPDAAYFKPHPPGFGLRGDLCGAATLAPLCSRLVAGRDRLIAAHDTDVPDLAPIPDTGNTYPAPAGIFSTQPKVTACY